MAITRNARNNPVAGADKDLVIEEYRACRDLIGRNIEIIERNEVYVVGACAVVFVFSIDKGDNLLTLITAFLPLALALIGRKRYIALDETISTINKYLIIQETRYGAISYSSYYEGHKKRHNLGNACRSVWTILIWASLIFAAYKIYVALNPFKNFCTTHPRAAVICRPPEPTKSST